jgi:hypothetical protein
VNALTTSGGNILYLILAAILVLVVITASRPDRWVIVLRVIIVSAAIAGITYGVNAILPGPLASTAVAVAHSHNQVPSTAATGPATTFQPVIPVAASFACGILEIPFAPIATLVSLLLGAMVAYNTADIGLRSNTDVVLTIVLAAIANGLAFMVIRPKKI